MTVSVSVHFVGKNTMAGSMAQLQDLDYFMMHYYSYKSGLQDWDSQTLVYLKMGQVYDENRKDEFIHRIQAWLRKNIKEINAEHPGEEIIFGFAPGHSPNSESFMTTELDIDSLCNNPQFSVHPKLLERIVKVQKQATGGERSIDTHLGSIKVTKDVANKIVCIMDDVWTTGCTLSACYQLANKKGAKKVYTLAIGKTVLLQMQEDNDF